MLRGTWSDPHELGEVLATYAARWIRERGGLSERTVRLYEGLLRLHVAPVLGAKDIRRLTSPMVRSWRQGLIDGGVGASTVAKAYRFLRAVLNTAFEDEVIRRNPCRIKGAAVERPEELPVLTLGEVQLLAAAIDPRYRVFVLLAVFGSLRWGELMGLRRSDFDLEAGVVRIERAVSEMGAKQIIKEPKTDRGCPHRLSAVVGLPEFAVSSTSSQQGPWWDGRPQPQDPASDGHRASFGAMHLLIRRTGIVGSVRSCSPTGHSSTVAPLLPTVVPTSR